MTEEFKLSVALIANGYLTDLKSYAKEIKIINSPNFEIVSTEFNAFLDKLMKDENSFINTLLCIKNINDIDSKLLAFEYIIKHIFKVGDKDITLKEYLESSNVNYTISNKEGKWICEFGPNDKKLSAIKADTFTEICKCLYSKLSDII